MHSCVHHYNVAAGKGGTNVSNSQLKLKLKLKKSKMYFPLKCSGVEE